MVFKITLVLILGLWLLVIANSDPIEGYEHLLLLTAGIMVMIKIIPDRQAWSHALYRKLDSLDESKKTTSISNS
ncbi:MAG: hypothetical protein WCQ99_02720 [Pseudomonadota bacterium]